MRMFTSLVDFFDDRNCHDLFFSANLAENLKACEVGYKLNAEI